MQSIQYGLYKIQNAEASLLKLGTVPQTSATQPQNDALCRTQNPKKHVLKLAVLLVFGLCLLSCLKCLKAAEILLTTLTGLDIRVFLPQNIFRLSRKQVIRWLTLPSL